MYQDKLAREYELQVRFHSRGQSAVIRAVSIPTRGVERHLSLHSFKLVLSRLLSAHLAALNDVDDE